MKEPSKFIRRHPNDEKYKWQATKSAPAPKFLANPTTGQKRKTMISPYLQFPKVLKNGVEF